MKLFILDDDLDFIENISQLIKHELDVDECVINGNYLQKCDVYFLDIDIPKKNGIEIAYEIKQKYPQSLIVFVSHREDLIFEAMQTFPYYFVRKRNLNIDLQRVLSHLKEKFNPIYIDIETTVGMIHLDISKIFYIEKIGHYSYVKVNDDVFKTILPLKWYKKNLKEDIFEYVSQSILVNVKHIRSESQEYVIMDDFKKFFYSRGRRSRLKVKYINQRLK